MDKAALRQSILERLEADLAVLVAAARSSKDQATDAESKPDGKYDMAGQSAAYLAAGQSKLATELAEAISAYRLLPLGPARPGNPAEMGSIVIVESGKTQNAYFIGPARGGMEIELAGESVTVITAVSPLGRQLIGRRVGDPVTLPDSRQGRVLSIL